MSTTIDQVFKYAENLHQGEKGARAGRLNKPIIRFQPNNSRAYPESFYAENINSQHSPFVAVAAVMTPSQRKACARAA
ncbi:MAG: hypothetical protein ACLQHK_00255, partial [Gallionellaceae bacterium]